MATQKGRNWSSGDIVTAANLSSIERGVSAVAEEYTPTTWANGDTVTATGLNNIEQGIANAGGNSDFSTATVTVINNTEFDPWGFRIPNICEVNELGEGSPAMIYNIMICASGESTHLVRMYKGLLYCNDVGFPPSTTVSTSGNITIENETVSITGDCTITIGDDPIK